MPQCLGNTTQGKRCKNFQSNTYCHLHNKQPSTSTNTSTKVTNKYSTVSYCTSRKEDDCKRPKCLWINSSNSKRKSHCRSAHKTNRLKMNGGAGGIGYTLQSIENMSQEELRKTLEDALFDSWINLADGGFYIFYVNNTG